MNQSNARTDQAMILNLALALSLKLPEGGKQDVCNHADIPKRISRFTCVVFNVIPIYSQLVGKRETLSLRNSQLLNFLQKSLKFN